MSPWDPETKVRKKKDLLTSLKKKRIKNSNSMEIEGKNNSSATPMENGP